MNFKVYDATSDDGGGNSVASNISTDWEAVDSKDVKINHSDYHLCVDIPEWKIVPQFPCVLLNYSNLSFYLGDMFFQVNIPIGL